MEGVCQVAGTHYDSSFEGVVGAGDVADSVKVSDEV